MDICISFVYKFFEIYLIVNIIIYITSCFRHNFSLFLVGTLSPRYSILALHNHHQCHISPSILSKGGKAHHHTVTALGHRPFAIGAGPMFTRRLQHKVCLFSSFFLSNWAQNVLGWFVSQHSICSAWGHALTLDFPRSTTPIFSVIFTWTDGLPGIAGLEPKFQLLFKSSGATMAWRQQLL